MKALIFTVTAFLLLTWTDLATAQTTLGYRQVNLACHIQCDPPNKPEVLVDPWGIAFLPGQNFLLAERGSGRVDSYDAAGLLGSGFSVPLPAGSTVTTSRPTGIVADAQANLGIGQTHFQFFVATEEGTIVGFNVVNGQFQDAQVVVNRSSSAAFTGLTMLHPSCCTPALAAANFRAGEIDLFSLSATAYPGSFQDPTLPDGYSPYNIQTVGDQVFVMYAKKDQTGAPVKGDGLGIVSVFDQEGNFVRRFVSEGAALNIPWGVTQTSANFGPFPNKLLIGNTGDDGRILVYDPTSAELLGTLTNSEGFFITDPGMRALVFRGDHASDGVGDPDNLYYTAASINGLLNDGLFATVQVGRLTTTQLTLPEAQVGVQTTLTAEVHPVAGGDTASGEVRFLDNFQEIGTAALAGGIATFQYTFTTGGLHNVIAEYEGTDNLLESFALQTLIIGPTTTTTLTGPTSVAVGTSVRFQARTVSGNTPVTSGNMTFMQGSNFLGVHPVDANGTATVDLIFQQAGTFSLTASYSGGNFQPSTSAPLQVSAGGDFDFHTNVPAVTVPAGQSANVMLTVNPTQGFTGDVTFNCVAPAGISCAFNPPTVNVNGAVANATLTVRSSTVARAAHAPGLVLASFFGLFGTLLMGGRTTRKKTAFTLIAILAFGMSLVACGGYGQNSGGGGTHNPPQTFTVTVNASSQSVSHSTNLVVTVQ